MNEIVTLPETKAWLRVDGDDEDATIDTLIAAATEATLAMAEGYDPAQPVPARLKLAVLTHVAQAFGDREAGAAMPDGAARLVTPFRVLGV